ncbi:hypothetical protein BKA70DRAFT_1226186 [Coprinopsis sp. MPI-PUGE-AT-0042]|nr:hypothetical protein BKA70DRAFT_1226186 [Coprinopsis sp. MPI-PUGE-AT-0042]
MLENQDALVSMTRWAALWQATTLDQEIEFIGCMIQAQEVVVTTFLYVVVGCPVHHLNAELITRYAGGYDVHSLCDQFFLAAGEFLDKGLRCPSVLQVQTWLSEVTLLAMNGIIVKRVMCMYNNDRRVSWILAAALSVFTVHAATVTILTSDVESAVRRIQSANLYEMCQMMPAYSLPSWYWTFAILMLVFDSIVLGFSLLQVFWFACENRRIQRHGRKVGIIEHLWRTRRTLASVLLRDSILFPFIRLVVALLIILAWTARLPPGSAEGIMVAAAVTVPTLGCRLLLNLRSTYYEPFREEYFQSQLQDRSLVFPIGSSGSIGR